MYAQSLPSRRNTQEFHVEGLSEEHSLLDRWMVLVGDTLRAVKNNFIGHPTSNGISAEQPDDVYPEATIPLPTTPEQERPTVSSRSRLPLPNFIVQPESQTGLRNESTLLPPLPSLTSSSSTQTCESISTTSPTTEPAPVRLRYPKHNHVHLAQHKQRVQEHNKNELERLKNRSLQYDEEWDMEKTLLNAKRIFAEEAGDSLFKEWQTQRHLGSYKSDFDSFAGLHTYRQLLSNQKENIDIPASPSLPDLSLSVSKSKASLPRRGSFSLERALQIAHQTLNEPRPRIPSFEKLRITARQKDREINKRIRQATRLPTRLPPQAVEEVRLLRQKRGVIAKIAKEQVADTDISRLDPRGASLWLNDEIINFYGALLMQRAERYIAEKENRGSGIARKGKEPEYLNIHYFNTFFWPKVEKRVTAV